MFLVECHAHFYFTFLRNKTEILPICKVHREEQGSKEVEAPATPAA